MASRRALVKRALGIRRTGAAPPTRFAERQEVDFVIVGCGTAGGILAKQLSTRGFSVVVLEQGPYLRAADFGHDELSTFMTDTPLTGSPQDFPQTFRTTEDEEPRPGGGFAGGVFYARMVGGSSAHFTGNMWRFRPIDFHERSLFGAVPGANLADWPVTYEELEPYYTQAEWEMGISGAPGPNDPPRSRGYPMPPLPIKSSGVLLERGARAAGFTSQPAPMAILSRAYRDRPACQHCGFCLAFPCEYNAKSSTLVAMVPLAEATGRCEIRPHSTVFRVELDDAGRAKQVVYYDAEGVEHAQAARAVILSANGAETSRLLLMSESSRFPDGLANSSGYVGKHLMFNAISACHALFDEPLNEFKSVQVTRIVMDFYDSDPARGFYGGGGIDARWLHFPIMFGLGGLPSDAPSWGPEYARMLSEYFNRTMDINGHCTSLPLERNNITLDPTVKDKWGLPAIRTTYLDHPDDMAMKTFLQDRGMEILEGAGARRAWRDPVVPETLGAHLLGTARMGKDPATSVVDEHHRTHDVPNLFLCDGSSFVTSGRGQPTLTIMALAFRAGEHIAGFAERGEI